MINDKEVVQMRAINKVQAEFYNSISLKEDIEEETGYARHDKANLITKFWAGMRYKQQQAFIRCGVDERKALFHKEWIDRKRGGRFLEIGCFRGTRSSWPLIEAAGTYLGIDLSQNAVDSLNKKIAVAGLQSKARAIATDFLSFGEAEKWDIVFAHGVLHHFQHSEVLFSKIANLLNDNGYLILTEPSMVNRLFQVVRIAYRPFQSDSGWEWPFTRLTVANLETYLEPIDGFGWGRRSMPFTLLLNVPWVGKMFENLYVLLLSRELRSGWGKEVWLNATVTAVYKKRTTKVDAVQRRGSA